MNSQGEKSSDSPSYSKPEDTIILISGLPRSGKFIMMKILQAGVIPMITRFLALNLDRVAMEQVVGPHLYH